MDNLQFTLGEIFTMISVAVATATLMFGFIKWRDGAIHKRIDEIKKEAKDDISEIKANYAHRNEMDKSLKNVESLMRDMKQEQHRMAQRMDEFLKWLMQLQSGKNNDN